MTHALFSKNVLQIEPERVSREIEGAVRDQVFRELHRRGMVIGLSGGIDSSVTATLCARAVGPERVLGLLLPDSDTSTDATRLGRLVADTLGIRCILEDITPVLEAVGCYRRREEAIRTILPEFGAGYRCKVVRPSLSQGSGYSIFWLVAQDPKGNEHRVRFNADAYLGTIAATNFKQRTRKMIEYYYADRHQYASVGTPNRLEYDQGFFVKNGDGAADLKPIAHLYKSQVYQLAEHLRIPEEIRLRPPTTDTYSLPQSQDEFYFTLPYEKLDLCLYGRNHGVPTAQVAAVAGLTEEQVEWAYRDIEAKRQATRYQHLKPLLVQEIPEVGA